MATHYLTKEDLAIYYKKELTKKEIKAQAVGHTITINDDQIVIIANQKFSKLAKPDN